MKKIQTCFLSISILTFIVTSCQNSSGAVWEDTKTASRYLQRRGKSLFGKSSESRMVGASEDFFGPVEEEFIPLCDDDLKAHVAVPQPKSVPGEGRVPGIDMFLAPAGAVAQIFKTLHFNTDEHVLREEQDISTLQKIAAHLKKHSNIVVFIEGHCDERASEAYNLALGTRRSNYVREQLVKAGVNPEQIHTTSYGKERPLDTRHSRDAWQRNRRAEFKLYEAR